MSQARPGLLPLIALGSVTGLLSGLFGIGGGILLVPMLVGVLHFSQRLAAGTSVAAILPAAIAGGISYGLQGNVDWLAALALAIGVIIGAQLGALLLSRAPTQFLRWAFMIFLATVVVSLWFVIPQRDAAINLTAFTFSMLVVTGLITGILSGLLGVGGGVIIVAVLMFFFGASDLIAKGTSLMMIIPGSISGTLGNARRKNVDLRAALILGLAASVFSPLGTFIAAGIAPFWSNVIFSALIAAILVQMLVKQFRTKQ